MAAVASIPDNLSPVNNSYSFFDDIAEPINIVRRYSFVVEVDHLSRRTFLGIAIDFTICTPKTGRRTATNRVVSQIDPPPWLTEDTATGLYDVFYELLCRALPTADPLGLLLYARDFFGGPRYRALDEEFILSLSRVLHNATSPRSIIRAVSSAANTLLRERFPEVDI